MRNEKVRFAFCVAFLPRRAFREAPSSTKYAEDIFFFCPRRSIYAARRVALKEHGRRRNSISQSVGGKSESQSNLGLSTSVSVSINQSVSVGQSVSQSASCKRWQRQAGRQAATLLVCSVRVCVSRNGWSIGWSVGRWLASPASGPGSPARAPRPCS